MILPTNGKVVIFDDQYEQIEGLLKTLSKERVPFLYYKDELGEDLPDKPIKNVRLVFLDIELVSGQTLSNHNIISSIGARFEKVLEKNNNYVLIYWSTKEKKYQEVLNQAFEERLIDYKPIVALSLNKSEALDQKGKIIDFIIKEIAEKSKNFNLFKIFALWENLVNDSAGNLINDFTNFIGKDSNWDENAKHVLYKLSQAYSGKTISKKEDEEKLQDSFSTLNQVLIDHIENDIKPIIEANKGIVKGSIVAREKDDQQYSSIINNKLLLSETTHNSSVPGCLFFVDDEFELEKGKLIEKRDKIEANPHIKEEDKVKALSSETNKIKDFEEREKNNKIDKTYNQIINGIITGEESKEKTELRTQISEKSINIELNISPLCDYAQEKMPLVRLLPGLLIESDLMDVLIKHNTYNYFSEGSIRFLKKDYYFLFDFRFLYSELKSDILKRPSNNKIRHQFLSDIQLRLGNHINRSGVIYVQ